MNYARPYVLAVAGTVSALVVACGNAGSSSDAAGGRDTPGPTTPDLTAAPRTRSRSPTRALDQWLDFLGNRLGGKPLSGTCVLEPAETCTSSSTATVTRGIAPSTSASHRMQSARIARGHVSAEQMMS